VRDIGQLTDFEPAGSSLAARTGSPRCVAAPAWSPSSHACVLPAATARARLHACERIVAESQDHAQRRPAAAEISEILQQS